MGRLVRGRTSALALGTLAVVAACGGTSRHHADPGAMKGAAAGSGAGQAGASSDPVPVDEYGDALAGALCRFDARCYPFEYDDAPGGCLGVLTHTLDSTVTPPVRAAVEGGTATYDPAGVRDCFEALAALDCEVALPSVIACPTALVGRLPLGGACHDDFECEGDAYCAGGCPGRCTARGAPGADCSNGGQCTSDADCRGSPNGTSTCVLAAPPAPPSPFAGLGEPCDTSAHRCAPGTVCARGPLQPDGSTDDRCANRAAPGGACRWAEPDMCPAGEVCTIAASTAADAAGTCTALPKPGDPCTSVDDCSYVGPCVEGACRARADNGASCATNDACWSYVCASGVCVAPLCEP